MALWLASRGENWLLVEGPMLPRQHPTLGRCLFTSRAVRRGETLVEVSRDLIATPSSLPEELRTALPGEITDWGRMAIFLVLEMRKGEASQWAPYVQSMPSLGKLDSTVFWNDSELALLKGSTIAEVTRERRRMMEEEYAALSPVMQSRLELFDSKPILESHFQHGYALVCSRAWMIEDLDHLSMIPFVDYFNHDGESISHLCYDKEAGLAYVDADRDYEPGEQVLISYGDASNATLALDFGFTLAENQHDQVSVWMPLPKTDPLKSRKAELLRSNDFDLQATTSGDPDGGAWFTLKESRSGAAGRGEGISRRLQAFQRVLSATSAELAHMEELASQGRKKFASRGALARTREAEALLALLERLEAMYDECRAQERLLARLLSEALGGVLGKNKAGPSQPEESFGTASIRGGEAGSSREPTFDEDIDVGVLAADLQRDGGPESARSGISGVSPNEALEGEKSSVRKHRVQMAYDVLRGEARVLRSAVAWLRPRSTGGGYEQLMYGE